MYKAAIKNIYKAIYGKEYDYRYSESKGRSIYNFLLRLEEFTGIELLEKHDKELVVIAKEYFIGDKKKSGFTFKKLFDEVIRKKVIKDKLNKDFTDVIDDLYIKLKESKSIEENNFVSDIIKTSELIFEVFISDLDKKVKRVYFNYTDKSLEEINLEDNLNINFGFSIILNSIDKLKWRYKHGLSTNLIMKIFLEHFKRRVGELKSELEEEINFTKEFEPKYNIPNKPDFTLKEIGEIILDSGEETDEKKVQANLRKTFSEMGLSLYYSRKSKVYDDKYKDIAPKKINSKIPRERVINVLIEREVRRRKLKGRAITKTEAEYNMDSELRRVKDQDYYKRFEEFYKRGNAIYARETNRGELNNKIIEYEIKIFSLLENILSN